MKILKTSRNFLSNSKTQQLIKEELKHSQKIKEVDHQKIEDYIKANSLNNKEIYDLAINFSIIKQNEFKSLNRKVFENIHQKDKRFKEVYKTEDIAFEQIEDELIKDKNKSQNEQMRLAQNDRTKRFVFLEEYNQNFQSSQFNDIILEKYSKQIGEAFPNSQQLIKSIMKIDVPFYNNKDISKKEALSDNSKENQQNPEQSQQGKKDRKSNEQKGLKQNFEQIKIENQSFEQQQSIKKVLLSEAGGESASENESDIEDMLQAQQEGGKRIGSKKEGDMFGEYAFRKDKIFKFLTIQDKNVRIPDQSIEDKDKLTLFIEIDDVLLHTFICDENFGYISNPASKEPEYQFFLEEIRQPVLVYMRDYWQEFLDYLKQNQDFYEPILYTNSLHPYMNRLLKLIDPNQQVFKIFLYQNACYILEIKEENVIHLIKDISQFRNRNIERMVLIDPKPTNYMMTPENAIPVIPYTAEFSQVDLNGKETIKDMHLLQLISELEDIKDLEDVRPALQQKFQVRQLLKNSKLI